MNTIMIKCFSTARWVSTGIDIDPQSFNQIPDVVATTRCPACGQDHSWSKKDTLVCEFATPGSQSGKQLFTL
ncbi:MAG: hypothetical protein QOF19_1956 [Alphaproteobacteria bacterium]|jgi:hypothetical protein|nr:hypothetical protein [Alphaproteobacteria bacterium]